VGLVAAQRNQAVHLLNGQLIQQGVPHGVVIFQAAQLDQFGAARSAGNRGFGVGVVGVDRVGSRVIVRDIVERSLHVGRHCQVGGGRSGLRVVGKAVGAGQIRRVAACKVKLVGGRNSVRSALVVTGIGDGGGDVVGFAVDDGVGIAVDGDHIVPGFQHIGFGVAVVIGSHILHVEG